LWWVIRLSHFTLRCSNVLAFFFSETGASPESLNLYSNISTLFKLFKVLKFSIRMHRGVWLELVLTRYWEAEQRKEMVLGVREIRCSGEPVLDNENGEELMRVQPGTDIVLGNLPRESPGTLYITTKYALLSSFTLSCIVGCSIQYSSQFVLHTGK